MNFKNEKDLGFAIVLLAVANGFLLKLGCAMLPSNFSFFDLRYTILLMAISVLFIGKKSVMVAKLMTLKTENKILSLQGVLAYEIVFLIFGGMMLFHNFLVTIGFLLF